MTSVSKTVTYSITGYPTVRLTTDGDQYSVRPMQASDGEALLEFFRGVPASDRFYLKEDVTSPAVIERWVEYLDYSRALPLIATKDGKIIGDGTLHHSRSGARRHVAEVRVVVHPDYRNLGVGRGLLRCLTEIAHQKDIDKLTFEIVSGTEEPARRAAHALGFAPVAILPGHVQDIDGIPHDLVIMELNVSDVVGRDDVEIL